VANFELQLSIAELSCRHSFSIVDRLQLTGFYRESGVYSVIDSTLQLSTVLLSFYWILSLIKIL